MSDFEIIIELLSRKDIYTGKHGSGGGIPLPFEISPMTFLNYAAEDMKGSGERSMVNALSNIKRSIDSQMDYFLYSVGYLEKTKKERWHFPDKIKLLNEIGILAPSILKKINTKRNALEHDYKHATREEVEDFFDVAQLFIALTNVFIRNVLENFEIETEARHPTLNYVSEKMCSLEFNYKKSLFRCEICEVDKAIAKKIVTLEKDEDEYKKLLKFIVEATMTESNK